VTVGKFQAEDGADAHCQVNNLRLVHDVVSFDWLDSIVSPPPPPVGRRLLNMGPAARTTPPSNLSRSVPGEWSAVIGKLTSAQLVTQ
jgi:hypothetical protein